MQKFCRELKAFHNDARGTVTILSAIALTILLAFASLGAEYGAGLLLQSENQRIADSAAYIAATYCGANGECASASSLSTATQIAQNIGALNGIPALDVTPTIVTSPSGTVGAEALQVKVSTQKLLMITPIQGAPSSLSLTALSYGQIGQAASASACVVSLSATAGIALTGGVTLSAPTCGIATNNTITIPCGTHLTGKTISYDTAAPTVGCSNMSPSTATKAAVTDPLASLTGVTTAQARVATVQAMTAPSAPSVTVTAASGGTAWPSALTNLGYYPTATVTDAATQCTASWNGSVWTITGCVAGTYNITSAIVSGPGINFMPGGPSTSVYNFNLAVNMGYVTSSYGPGVYNFLQPVTVQGTTAFGVESTSGGVNSFSAGAYNFSSTLTNSSGTLVFGPGNINAAGAVSLNGSLGLFNATSASASSPTISSSTFGATSYTYNFAGGLYSSGSSANEFGPGAFNFGALPAATCTGAYSLCVSGSTSTTFGVGAFTFSSGIYTSGGITLSMGWCASGCTSNSFQVGHATDGDALNIGGGSGGGTVELGDATCATCVFQFDGAITTGTGGSTVTLSAATQHDINGSITLSGATTLGAGVYTTSGYFVAGAYSGGGTITGSGVTIVFDAAFTGAYSTSNPTCAGAGFCLWSGYNSVTLTAPTTGTYQYLTIIGPAVASGNSTAGVTIGSGASNSVVSGALYVPNGSLGLSGAGGLSSGASGCLEIVANTISVTQGSNAATACTGLGATGVATSSIPAGIVQ